MTYADFKKKLERIDEILNGAGIPEDEVEIGINDHEKKAWSIDALNVMVDIKDTDHNPENAYIVIVSE